MKSVSQSLKKRKEVSLDFETLNNLEAQANQEGRSLKNYMEHILVQKANDFELSDAYKAEIDKHFDDEAKGLNIYISKEEFIKRTRRKVLK